MDVYDPIEFHSSWEKEMRDRLVQSGQMQTEYAIDYFVFPQNIPLEMPSFALGRPYWDNWMIYRMRQLGIPVVDATPKVMIVHQNHPAKNVYKPGEGWTGPEAKQNLEMIGGRKNIFTLLDATHTLQNGRMKRAMTYEHLRRRIDTISLLHPHLSPLMAVAGGVMRVLGPAWGKIRRGFTNNEQKQ